MIGESLGKHLCHRFPVESVHAERSLPQVQLAIIR
jgi:hypothetical protein